MKKPSLQQRLKTTPGLLDRYRADPGLRSKLPDRMLTPDQRGVRKRQTTQRLIGQPLASLQGTTLQDLAREVTRGEYDPLYRDNDKQRGVANRETGALADRAQAYYDALNKANDARTAQQKAATGEQDTALQGIGTTAQAAIDKARGEGEQRIQQDAQLRGGGLQADAVQNLAARMAEASARSAEGTRIDRGAGQKHGFNAETFARSSATAGAMRGGETQGDIARRGQGILSQITDARTDLGTRERGDYTKTLLGLRDRQAEIELGKAQILGSQTAAQVDRKSVV